MLLLPVADAPLAGVERRLSLARVSHVLLSRCEAESDCAPKRISEQATFFTGREESFPAADWPRRAAASPAQRRPRTAATSRNLVLPSPSAGARASAAAPSFRETCGSSPRLLLPGKKSAEKKKSIHFFEFRI